MNLFQKTMALGVCLAALACAPAFAQQSNTVFVGIYSVYYHVHADDVSGPFTPPGLNADVNNVETLYLAYVRRLSTHFQVEFAAGVPPNTDTIARGPAFVGSVPYNGQTIGHVSWFAPSLLLHYVFFDDSAHWRPYVGAGVNFTHFFDREINGNGQAVFGGPTSISLTNSVGPAVSLGMRYEPDPHWKVIASVNAARVKSDLTADTAGIIRRTTVDFRPIAIVFAMGYSF
ncbi:MAG: outer membrane beta-barrel protein [Burkholderiaceae bacterium]|nr:outer membrane beta-barrel protein [Burkholderiaceae bacterium]